MRSKEKRNRLLKLIMKTWRRLHLAVPRATRSLTTSSMMITPLNKLCRYLSWPDSDWADSDQKDTAPEGYFAVYVGADRARFVIKTESVNHPLFRKLLEEAENEYGFDFAVPLTLPCEISVFRGIMGTLNNGYGGDVSPNEGDDRLWLFSRRALDILN